LKLSESKIDKSIDIKGEICPYTLIETRDALKGMDGGRLLEVVSDYAPAAEVTIPNMCRKKDYPFEVIEEGGCWRILIKKPETA
jgi:tRNA 2-thiouridine synthesizing protein A